MGLRFRRTTAALALLACLGGGCADEPSIAPPPNILFVVWDTARLDRLGIYGAERDTTPFLDKYAKRGLVFEDCRSVAPSTVPSHGSMFTGLWPRDHGANHKNLWLASEHETLAEILSDSGYDTYSFSANPNITEMENFDQGFATEEHLWDEAWRTAALADLLEHYQVDDEGRPLDNRTGMARRLREGQLQDHEIKGCGALLGRGLGQWLDRDGRDPERPWFGFLNYMEAHYPLQPAREFRERLMSEDELQRSYRVDRSWPRIWDHVFGVEPMPPKVLASLDISYDAAIAELDSLFEGLIVDLEARGELENTIVILTSDHGENLGEHEMLDHRYSLSEELLRVPLVIWGESEVQPVPAGRSAYPAMSIDLFATIISAAQQAPWSEESELVDLLGTDLDLGPSRLRLAEFPNDFSIPKSIADAPPEAWSPETYARRLISVSGGGHKLIHSANQGESVQLFDLTQDPSCNLNIADTRPPVFAELDRVRQQYGRVESYSPGGKNSMSPVERDRLSAIGYGE